MKKITKAMAISLLASTVAISTVGCRYTVEIKDNEAPTKQEQQLQPTGNDKSYNTSTDHNRGTEKTEKSATSEKANKKDEKSSSHTTTKDESKKDDNEEKENNNKYVCVFCKGIIPDDEVTYCQFGCAHSECLVNYYKATGTGDWDDSPSESEEPSTSDTHYGNNGYNHSSPSYSEPTPSPSYDEPNPYYEPNNAE